MVRRLAVSVLVLPLVFSIALVAPAPASAEPPAPAAAADRTLAGKPKPDTRCKRAGKTTFRVWRIRSAVKVGYAKRFYLSPGEKVRKIRKVRRDQVLRARARFSYDGGAGVSGVAKLLVKAEAKVHASLVMFGKWNKSTRTTVKQTVRNPTKRNRKFVAFKATHQYRGKFEKLYCQKHPLQKYPTWISLGKGKWQTHEHLESGTIRCGAGYPGAVAKVVARRHCG